MHGACYGVAIVQNASMFINNLDLNLPIQNKMSPLEVR